MAGKIPQKAEAYGKERKKRKAWHRIVVMLACVVVFVTTYALILPAITLEKDTYCGLEEHQHGSECFETRLICGYEETTETGHIHCDACYEEQQTLICGLAESQGHIHDAGCVGTEQKLICAEEHEHTDTCYETVETYICGKTEGEGGHIHGPECYETQKVLVCDIPESETAEGAHIHTEDCYEKVLICPLEEHTHSLACHSNPEADLETAADWEKTFAGVEMSDSYAQNLLVIARTQLGYTESEKNYAVVTDPDTNEETIKGYTRYGAWYGDSYGDWCAMYISFCLNYADVPAEDFPREASCQSWVEKLSGVAAGYENFALYREAGTYTPTAGDLVFFDWDQDGAADHVGIAAALSTEEAEKLSETDRENALDETILALNAESGEASATGAITLITIEGNSGNRVQTRAYTIDDETILGYGQLPKAVMTQAVTGEDYIVTVSYGPEAGLPADAVLCVNEYPKDSEIYQQRYAEAALLYGWETEAAAESGSETASENNAEDGSAQTGGRDDFRLFSIGFYAEDTEIEPAAPVQVGITYIQQPVGQTYQVVHFGDEAPETVPASIEEGDGGQTLDFSLDSFSDIGILSVASSKTVKDNSGNLTIINGADTRSVIQVDLYDYGGNINSYYTSSNKYPGFQQEYGTSKYINGDWSWSIVEKLNFGNSITADLNAGIQGLRFLTNPGNINNLGSSGPNYAGLARYPASIYEGNYVKVMSNTLGTDGYPALKDGTSLGYLFGGNGTYSNSVTKMNTESVNGLFQYDAATGLYYYDSRKNHAQFNEGDDTITLYEQTFTPNYLLYPFGNFYPFNDIISDSKQSSQINAEYLTEIADSARAKAEVETDSTYKKAYDNLANYLYSFVNEANRKFGEGWTAENPLNQYASTTNGELRTTFTQDQLNSLYTLDYDVPTDHYFGMNVKMNFIQSKNGVTSKGQDMSLRFNGDDDVWIYIDDILFLDLSGIHSHIGGEIDFYKGEVRYYTFKDWEGNVTGDPYRTVSFEQILKDAGLTEAEIAAKLVKKNGVYTTFKDYSFHSMNFYYMERGAGSSICSLEFNMEQTVPTGIYKVDQYGDAVPGAAFAAYSTNADHQYIADDGTAVALPDKYTLNQETGVITFLDGGKTVTITPKYLGETDNTGQMIFQRQEEDGRPYSLDELRELFGSDTFVVREIRVPDGYRTVSDEIFLKIEGGLLHCDDTYKTGVWASPTALVTAGSTLKNAETGEDVTYLENGKLEGTLFAVVLKRNTAGYADFDSWTPVYGSDMEGYTAVQIGENETGNEAAAIRAAKLAQQYGDVEFKLGFNNQPQLMLDNLPGKPERYYTYMRENDLKFEGTGEAGTDLQYLVAYYYTTASSLDGATADNTFRVTSHGSDQVLLPENEQFIVAWGSTIEVPNVENRLFFQKLSDTEKDDDGLPALENGATFALYHAVDAPSAGSADTRYIYYLGTDVDRETGGNTVYVTLLSDGLNEDGCNAAAFLDDGSGGATMVGYGTYEIDGQSGKITVTITEDRQHNPIASQTFYVFPARNADGEILVGDTHASCAFASEEGTGHFMKLLEGSYFLREISAPANYYLNNANIPVLVNAYGVYANAGNADDGVAVGNGIGYLSKTLDVFASEGSIDETLTWIYAALLRNDTQGFTAFNEVSGDVIRVSEGSSWHFVAKGTQTQTGYGNAETYERGEAMVTYLTYNGELSHDPDRRSVFDYTPTTSQEARERAGTDGVATLAGEGTIRLYVNTGWSDLAVYQDYAYGVGKATTGSSTSYDDITSLGNISNLFSSSTFVRVTDQSVPPISVQIKKVSEETDGTEPQLLPDAKFLLYRIETEEDGTAMKLYYAKDADNTVSWTKNRGNALILTTEANGIAAAFTGLSDGVYYLEETQAPPTSESETYVYRLLSAPIKLNIKNGAATLPEISTENAFSVDAGVAQDDGTILYTVTVSNTREDAKSVHLMLHKARDGDENSWLPGAVFGLYDNPGCTGTPVATSTPEGYTKGLYSIVLNNPKVNTTYYLREITAPDGYYLSDIVYSVTIGENSVITVRQPNGTAVAQDDWGNFLIFNTSGYELPDTGGAGTTWCTTFGLLMIAASVGVYGYKKGRRRERRNN